MKLFVIIASVCFLFSACGYQRTLRTHCHIGDTQTCDNLFGVNQQEIDEAQNAQLTAHEKEIQSLTTMMNELIKDLKSSESQYSQLQNITTMLNMMLVQQGSDILTINQLLVDIDQDLTDLEIQIANQQVQINAMAIDIANLQNQGNSVVLTEYPCGDAPGKFDEALLRLQSGKLLAYFEDGSNRMLTELKPGSYRSTDYSPYCHFNVDANNRIVSARRQ